MGNPNYTPSGIRIPLDICLWIQANWDEAKAINERITKEISEECAKDVHAATALRTATWAV